MNTVIKAHLNRADSTVEVRRIPLAVSGQDTSGILKEIASKVGSVFPGLADKQFTLKWKDSDGDLIMMTTDEEVMEAVSHAQNSPLKIFITVDGVKDTGAQEFMDIQSDRSQEPAEGDESTNEHEADFMRRPFCRPPPPGFAERPSFEHPMEFFGKICGSRKRGYPDYFNPRGHSGPHFGHLGPRGHHFMHLGPQGHHFGPQGPFGMLGAFGGHGFFEGPHSQHFPGEGNISDTTLATIIILENDMKNMVGRQT
uniref:PB1 domain-containing protein n=1 Tax=Arion vulgaris TaxID=1028688 RepID=A0A0B7BHA7_9EUPU